MGSSSGDPGPGEWLWEGTGGGGEGVEAGDEVPTPWGIGEVTYTVGVRPGSFWLQWVCEATEGTKLCK
ncbi:MAG: hypothetical protein AAGJ80_01585 [Cyanobacteria bacterium J06553_1]